MKILHILICLFLFCSARSAAIARSCNTSELQASEILVKIHNDHRTTEHRNLARIGFAKALYHISLLPDVSSGEGGLAGIEPANSSHTCYIVDLKAALGSNWQKDKSIIMNRASQSDPSFDKASQPFFANKLPPSSNEIYASRLAFNIFYPNNYNALGGGLAPDSRSVTRSRDSARFGYNNGIPCGPRLVAARKSQLAGKERWFFVSGDPSNIQRSEANSTVPERWPTSNGYGYGLGDIPRVPGREVSGGEAIQQLPNGLLRYYVFRNPGNIGTKALQTGVIDPANSHNSNTLVVGRSCVMCHSNGIRGAKPDTYGMPGYTQSEEGLEPIFTSARNEYSVTMKKIANTMSSGSQSWNDGVATGSKMEPISFLTRYIEGNRTNNFTYTSIYGSRGCQKNGSDGSYDLFQRQLQSQDDLIKRMTQRIKDDGENISESANNSTTNPGSNSANSSQTLNGSLVYIENCGGVSCHQSAEADPYIQTLSDPNRDIPAVMWFIGSESNKGIDPNGDTADEIVAYLISTQGTSQKNTAPKKDVGTGNDSSKSNNISSGKTLFGEKCGSCHEFNDSQVRNKTVPDRMWSQGGVTPNSPEAQKIQEYVNGG